MNRTSPLATFALLTLIAIAPRAQAQGVPTRAAEAARQQKLKAAQAAALAAARARAVPTVTTPPVATINRPIPTVTTPPVLTVPPVVTAPPKTTATAPATSSSAKPPSSAAPATSGSAAPVAVVAHPDTAAIALNLDELKKTRPDRRHAEFVDLQSRFGGLLSDPRATAELKQHAQRIAYLQRIRALGVKANDANFVKGVDALITTEETRDGNALNALRTSALPVAAPAAAAAAPAAGGSK